MIQYYINNRPVPRAIARARLLESLSNKPAAYVLALFDLLSAKSGNSESIKLCAAYGISIARI